MSELKEVKDLTQKELLEDLAYYIKQAQLRSSPCTDSVFEAVWDDVRELQKRENEKVEVIE